MSISRGAITCRRPSAATPRRCIIWRCSTPMAAARAPTTRARRNGSARRPIAASPTASSTSASSMPAASASNRTSPKSFKWFSLAAAQGDADAGAQARRYRQAARRPVARGGQARDPDLHRRTAARRRHQCGDPGRRLGRRPGAGQYGQTRGQAGRSQAHRGRERERIDERALALRCIQSNPMMPQSVMTSPRMCCVCRRGKNATRFSGPCSERREIVSTCRRQDLGAHRHLSRSTRRRGRLPSPAGRPAAVLSVAFLCPDGSRALASVPTGIFRDPRPGPTGKNLYFSPSMTFVSSIANADFDGAGREPARTGDRRDDRRRQRKLVPRQAR